MMDLAKTLRSGEALILPTETVYGLFAKALDEEAVNRVYALKKRPRDKALNLNVSSFSDILRFSKHQPLFLKKLYDAFLPGPLTIILEANDQVPFWINSGLESVGFRVPAHPVTLELIREEGPLIGPSANLSGKKSGRVFRDVVQEFEEKVGGYPDDAALTGHDSTILDLTGEWAKILRQGSITQAMLKEAIPELRFEGENE